MNINKIKIHSFFFFCLLSTFSLFLPGCTASLLTYEQEEMQKDIASIKKELDNQARANSLTAEELKAKNRRIENEVSEIKKGIELQSREIGSISDVLRRDKADISATLDRIKDEMAFLRGRFEESKFEAQKAKEAMESLQAKTADKKDVSDKFVRLESSIAALEKQMNLNIERVKGINDKIALLEKGMQEQKEAILDAVKKGVKEEAKTDLKETGVKEEAKAELKEEKKEEPPPSEPPKPEVLYSQGFQQIKEKDYSSAIGNFRKFINLFPEHDLADNAQYWIGEAYYAQKEYERAVLEFNEVIKKYPKGDKTAAAMVKQGMAFYELGNKTEARLLLERVKSRYPDTEEASIAKKKLDEIK